MPWTETDAARKSLATLQALGLLAAAEREAVRALTDAAGPIAGAVRRAETLHLHVKVDDTHALPLNEFYEAGGRLDHQKDGFVKFRFPGAVNAIFSHIAVSQDELAETAATRRPRPFLDHVGIDLRDTDADSRAAFDALPAAATALGWLHAAQGAPGRPVYCCHSSVAEKHWLYPGGGPHAAIPLEFAYGPLVIDMGAASGCDLRPARPGSAAANAACCAPSSGKTSLPSSASHSYYRPENLKRFGEIGRAHPALGEAFFRYYRQVMEPGMLDAREKALIALAVAHAMKCPYCIDAYTETLHGLGVPEAEMFEAVHVAAAMLAGITMVHSVQMMQRLDELGPVASPETAPAPPGTVGQR